MNLYIVLTVPFQLLCAGRDGGLSAAVGASQKEVSTKVLLLSNEPYPD